ncbi:uncharacterized protein LOC143288461 isoform X2 [Babylonia areolata]
MGVAGLVTIAVLTIHCCHLLVKSKYHAIKYVLHVFLHPNNFSVKLNRRTHPHWQKKTWGSKLITDHLLPPELLEQSGDARQRKEQAADIQRRLVKSMQYRDLTRMCFGQTGVVVTVAAILFTQMGFCVNYAIFTANTVQSFFPVYRCTVQLHNNVSTRSPDCQYLANSPWQSQLDKLLNDSRKDNGQSFGSTHAANSSLWAAARSEGDFSPGDATIQNPPAFSMAPKSDASLGRGRSPSSQPPQDSERSISVSNMFSSFETSSLATSSSKPLTKWLAPRLVISELATTATQKPIVTSETATAPVSESQTTQTTGAPFVDSLAVSTPAAQTVWDVSWTDSPDLRWFFLIPVVIFMLMVLPRRMRCIGFISTAGNLGLVCGILAVLITLITQFRMSDSWVWARAEGLPFLFGTAAAAFEGAGTILLVEGSMEGNRHNFTPYLSGSVTVLVLSHICTCVLGYLTFGSGIAQVVTLNLDMGSWLAVMVNLCLIMGALFTFPLMMSPVLQLTEAALQGEGRCCFRKDSAEDEALLESDPNHTTVPTENKSHLIQVPCWKRNVIRVSLVLVIVLLAVLLRDSFAFVSAFIGALGSTTVAFILPCAIHLRLCWPHLPLAVRVKDVAIVVLGLAFSATGIYTVVSDMTA